MAKRTRSVDGAQLRFRWKIYPMRDQEIELRREMRMVAELWNALLEIDNIIRRHGVWVFDASGPLIADLDGGLHAISLSDILLRRQMIGGYSSRVPIMVPRRGASGILPDDITKIRTRLPSEFDRGYWITSMLREHPEWRALSTWTPRRVVTSLAMAWKAMFTPGKDRIPGKKYGPPRFKRVIESWSLPHRCRTPGSNRGGSGCMLIKSNRHTNSWILTLKGVPGEVWARGELPIDRHGMRPTVVNEWMNADIMFSGGAWWFSVAVAIDRYRWPPSSTTPVATVEFGRVGCLAVVNNEPVIPEGIVRAQIMDDVRATKQSAFDEQWPRGAVVSDENMRERTEQRNEIMRISAKIARMRREALHEWTTSLVRRFTSLVIVFPSSVLENTQTPRGDEKSWGAEVEAVSNLNRNTLSYAPFMAKQMLIYKAKESGIRCDVVANTSPMVGVGVDLVTAGKSLRRARREVRKHVVRSEDSSVKTIS